MSQTCSNHHWADVTTFADEERQLYCFDCDVVFADGPAERAWTEPLESRGLRAEKLSSRFHARRLKRCHIDEAGL